MIKKIYFLRHGHYLVPHPRPNIDETQPIPLSLTGIEQIIKAGHKIKASGDHIEAIFSSPFVRTLETASLASKVLKVPLEVTEDLTEDSYQDGSVEHLDDIYRRFKRCVEKVLTLKNNIIIVSHELPISLYISHEKGLSYEEIKNDHAYLELLKMGECIKATYENHQLKNYEKI